MGEFGVLAVGAGVHLLDQVVLVAVLLDGAMGKDGRDRVGSVDLSDHDGSGDALEDEPGRRVREQAGIINAMDADDVISDGSGDHKEIVDLAEAGCGNGSLDDSAYPF